MTITLRTFLLPFFVFFVSVFTTAVQAQTGTGITLLKITSPIQAEPIKYEAGKMPATINVSFNYQVASASKDLLVTLIIGASGAPQVYRTIAKADLDPTRVQSYTIPITFRSALAAGNYSPYVSLKQVNAAGDDSSPDMLEAGEPDALVVYTPPTATISGTKTICSGTTTILPVKLSGKPPFSLTYTDETTTQTINNIPLSAHNISVSPGSSTTYTLTAVSDANGSGTVSGSAAVTVNPTPPAPVAWNTMVILESGTMNLFVKGIEGATYNWTGPNGFTSTIKSPAVPQSATGTYYVTATVNGCTSAPGSTTIASIKVDQTITFNALAGKTYGDAPFTLSASATSDLLVTYSIVSGPATVSGNTLTITGAGTVTVRASQSGNDTFKAAPDVDRTFTVNKGATYFHVSGYNGPYNGAPHGASVSVKGVNGEDLSSLLHEGASFINAPGGTAYWTFEGNTSYDSYRFSVNITITKAAQAITWSNPAAITYGEALSTVQLNASVAGVPGGSEAGALVYTPAVGTILNAGTQTLKVDAASTGNYNAASKTVTLEVKQATPTVILSLAPSYIYNGSPQGAAVTSVTGVGGVALGKTIRYEGVPPTVYAASSTAPTNAGTYQVTLAFDGSNPNYEAATDTKMFTITKETVTPTWTAGTLAQTYDGAVKTVAATTTPTGLKLNYDFGFLQPINAGSYPVTATITDANYEGSLSGTLIIAKAATTTTVTVSNATYDGSRHSGSATVSGAGGLNQSVTAYYEGVFLTVYASSTTAPVSAGSYRATATYAESANYLGSTNSKNFTIAKAPVTITGTNMQRQYSDPNPAFTGTVSGLVKSDGITASYTTPANVTSGPGTYSIVPALHDPNDKLSNYVVTPTNGTLTVTQEDANVTYSGLPYFSTASASAYTATVTLSATIKDITAMGSVAADPKYDPYAGDITNAKVTFRRDNPITGTILGTANVPLVLVGSDTKVGTVSTTFNYTLTTAEINNYGTTLTVYVVVGDGNSGYYTGTALPNTVTITLPGSQSVNGGGYLKNVNSIGKYAGTIGETTNFGFTMKYLKNGSGAKGQANIIVRSNNRTYQIKSNAINSMSTGATTATGTPASFSTKANLTDITNPSAPVSLGGNLDLFVNMNDSSAGGKGDAVSFLLQSGSSILFSSYWNGAKAALQKLSGGNVQVRNTGTQPTTPVTLTNRTVTMNTVMPETTKAIFNLTVFPNPSTTQFNVHVESSNATGKITLRIVDVQGRTLDVLNNVASGQTVQLGNNYRAGVYIVEMTQGNQRMQVKLLKVVY